MNWNRSLGGTVAPLLVKRGSWGGGFWVLGGLNLVPTAGVVVLTNRVSSIRRQ